MIDMPPVQTADAPPTQEPDAAPPEAPEADEAPPVDPELADEEPEDNTRTDMPGATAAVEPEPAPPPAPPTAAEIRQRAFANLVPPWTEARHRVAACKADVEDARAELKLATTALEKHDASLEHVGNCRQDPCLRCQEIALNAHTRGIEEPREDRLEAGHSESCRLVRPHLVGDCTGARIEWSQPDLGHTDQGAPGGLCAQCGIVDAAWIAQHDGAYRCSACGYSVRRLSEEEVEARHANDGPADPLDGLELVREPVNLDGFTASVLIVAAEGEQTAVCPDCHNPRTSQLGAVTLPDGRAAVERFCTGTDGCGLRYLVAPPAIEHAERTLAAFNATAAALAELPVGRVHAALCDLRINHRGDCREPVPATLADAAEEDGAD